MEFRSLEGILNEKGFFKGIKRIRRDLSLEGIVKGNLYLQQ